MRDYCLYIFYRAGTALIRAFPLPILFALGQVAGFMAWIVLPHYRRLALHNATIAFGMEKSPRQLRRLVRRHCQRLGANILCSVKVATLPLDQVARRIEVENLDFVHHHLRGGRPVVLVLSHLGNWELIAQILPKFIGYVRNSTIYQRLRNPLIDQHVRKMRGRAGVEMFDRKDGFQKAIELLRSGGAIGILSDQHAGDQGLWVPFFGKLASTSSLPALLARRTGAVLIGVAVYTDGRARWRIVVEPALETSRESIESLTARVNAMIAAQIRRAPEDWFWVHNRWKTPRPNFLLSKYKRGVYLPSSMPSEQLQPFRILIRASNWLGDAVMSVPAVQAIKKGRPDAHVTVLTPEKIAPVWKLIPEVDAILSIANKSLFSAVRTIRRQADFDVAILFPNSARAALEVWLGGISRRIGYRGHFRTWMLNQIVRERGKPGPPEHQSMHYLRIAEELGANLEEKAPPFSTPKAFGIKSLPSIISQANQRARVALCPGAEYGPAKRWLADGFAEAAANIAAEREVQWVLFGTSKEAPLGEAICQKLGDRCLNRIGQTSVAELVDELRTCRLLLTNDTGTMHLASLLGVPTVAIFGSTEPRLTGPLGSGHIVLRHQVECSPCFLRECPIDFRCMKAVGVGEVVAAVKSILDRTNKSSEGEMVAAGGPKRENGR